MTPSPMLTQKSKRFNGFLYSLCLTNSRNHTPYYIITHHYHKHSKIKKRDTNGQHKSCKTLPFFERLKPDQKLSLRLHFLWKGISDGHRQWLGPECKIQEDLGPSDQNYYSSLFGPWAHQYAPVCMNVYSLNLSKRVSLCL